MTGSRPGLGRGNWLPGSPFVSYIQSSLNAAKNLVLSHYSWSLQIAKCWRVKQLKCQELTSHLIFLDKNFVQNYQMMSAETSLFKILGKTVLLFLVPASIYSKPNEVTATENAKSSISVFMAWTSKICSEKQPTRMYNGTMRKKPADLPYQTLQCQGLKFMRVATKNKEKDNTWQLPWQISWANHSFTIQILKH